MYKRIMGGLIVAAALLGIGILFELPPKEKQTEAPKPVEVTIPDTPADAEAAKVVYRENCLSCHGTDLQGKIGPALDRVGAEMTKEQIYRQIVVGGGGMPTFEKRLTKEQLINLTNWLAAMK
ncbi:c-type cytochrome [Cohnella sp. CFH 77786]|uniref:c-type cytochrome n=1 Tax=Cohnella sp. CFH 77786 TaxID=2662265 RepID=UPI001C60D0B8|nr:cytochrome c [Cohnella sp. CFH 77786]MBW5446386.1 c-type cytochrome [Cohnella sp. CFH 77786]